MDRRGMMMNGIPRGLNIIMGLLAGAFGALGIFGGQVGFVLPELPAIIYGIVIALVGLIMALDGMMGSGMGGVMPRKQFNLPVGFLVLLAGVGSLLMYFGTIPNFTVPTIVMYGIVLFAGVVLILDGILGIKSY